MKIQAIRHSLISAFLAVYAAVSPCVPFGNSIAAEPAASTASRNPAIEARERNSAGVEFLSKKDFASAHTQFAAAISLDPSVKHYYNNLAVACMNRGMYAEAILHLEKAIQFDPHYVRALSNMAISCFHLAEYRRAYGYYRRAGAADRAYTEGRFNLAKVISGMEKIQRENPDNAALKSILTEVKGLERMP